MEQGSVRLTGSEWSILESLWEEAGEKEKTESRSPKGDQKSSFQKEAKKGSSAGEKAGKGGY